MTSAMPEILLDCLPVEVRLYIAEARSPPSYCKAAGRTFGLVEEFCFTSRQGFFTGASSARAG